MLILPYQQVELAMVAYHGEQHSFLEFSAQFFLVFNISLRNDWGTNSLKTVMDYRVKSFFMEVEHNFPL